MKGKKYDGGKERWDLVHWDAMTDLAKVLTYGAKKYDDHNWKLVLDGKGGRGRYFAAAMRHLIAWESGESLDPGSGLPHLAHAQCCLMFLSYDTDNCTDPLLG